MKVEQQKDSKQKKIVQIEDLSVSFDGMEVVKHVNIEVNSGEIVGIVGESGSGKSITSLTLMGLLSKQAQVTSGKIIVDGEVLREADRPFDEKMYRRFQGSRMSMIFQEPMTSLNPTKKAGVQVDEIVRLHTELEKEKRYEKVLETFQAVGLKDAKKVYDSYPHQLSGGMRQRVMIAMAVILHPDLIIADEPTTALDVTIQTQIVELLKDINKSEQNAVLFITHDLNLARRICHKVVVMKDGVVQQVDTPQNLYNTPCNLFVAGFIGSPQMNFMDAVVDIKGNDVTLTVGKHTLKVPASKKQALIDGGYNGRTVVLGIRPEDVHDSQAFISNSPDSVIESTIKVYELLGAEVYLYFDLEGTQMTARVNPRTTLRNGDHAVFALDMEKIHIFDKETELTITN